MGYRLYARNRLKFAVHSTLERLGVLDPKDDIWTDRLVGKDLSRNEKRSLVRIYFENCAIFRWQSGDMVLLDNLKTAHAGLNIDAEREISLFTSQYIDKRDVFGQKEPGNRVI